MPEPTSASSVLPASWQSVVRIHAKRRRDGRYYLPGDRVYPAVTEILKVTGFGTRPLMTWAAKTAASLVLADPDTYDSADKAAGGIYAVRDKAAGRGSTVHSLAEAMDRKGDVLIELLPELVRGYAQAYKTWYDTHRPEVLFIEATVWNDQHKYAGTTDLICRLGDGRTWLIDRKTGKAVYLEAYLQASAYMHAEMIWPHDQPEPQPMPHIDAAGILLLSPDGTHDFKEVTPSFEAFLHAKGLFEWTDGRS